MERDEISPQDIIEMARQAGFDISKPNRIIVRHSNGSWISIKFELEAFAKLVAEAAASKEREACAKVCDDRITHEAGMQREDYENRQCAIAIRARGEA